MYAVCTRCNKTEIFMRQTVAANHVAAPRHVIDALRITQANAVMNTFSLSQTSLYSDPVCY